MSISAFLLTVGGFAVAASALILWMGYSAHRRPMATDDRENAEKRQKLGGSFTSDTR